MTTMPSPNAWATAYTCKWDAWNRLVQVVQSGSEVAAYRYDAITRRIVKTVDEESYHLYYDTQWRVLDEWVDGAVKSQYVWSPFDRWNLIRRQRVTSGSSFNETYYVLRDYLDPVAIVTTNGTVAERYRYDAFGPATKLSPTFMTPSTSTAAWTWLFHGEFIDLETGLYNYGYRYYHPQLGRWLSRDPIAEEGGLNLYAAVNNNDINDTDFLGLNRVTAGEVAIISWIEAGKDGGFFLNFNANQPPPDFLSNEAANNTPGNPGVGAVRTVKTLGAIKGAKDFRNILVAKPFIYCDADGNVSGWFYGMEEKVGYTPNGGYAGGGKVDTYTEGKQGPPTKRAEIMGNVVVCD